MSTLLGRERGKPMEEPRHHDFPGPKQLRRFSPRDAAVQRGFWRAGQGQGELAGVSVHRILAPVTASSSSDHSIVCALPSSRLEPPARSMRTRLSSPSASSATRTAPRDSHRVAGNFRASGVTDMRQGRAVEVEEFDAGG